MDENEKRAAELANKIKKEVAAAAGKGLNAARIFIAGRIKEALSVPAPRKRVHSLAGHIYYRATTKAKVGDPPRKLSGRFRTSVTSTMIDANTAEVGAMARGDNGFNYPKYHEIKQSGHPGSGLHQSFEPTIKQFHTQIVEIVGSPVHTWFQSNP
jgi:hypothetical protein